MDNPMQTTSPEAVGLSSQRLQRINSLMQDYVDNKTLAGVITVVARHGKIAHWERFGMSDIEANLPMQDDAIFRIYSMSKLITCVAAMTLYEEGRFQLEDPVARYIPALAGMKVCSEVTTTGLLLVDQEREMTIRDLMLHTSGLPGGSPEGSPVEVMYHDADLTRPDRTLQAMVQELGKLPLICQPGSAWRYGLSTDVLGHLVEVVADTAFDEFLAQRIFTPLAMPDSGFFVPSEDCARLAVVYEPADDGGLARIDRPDINQHSQPCQYFGGGGGLVSTTADFLRFAQMMLNGGHLDDATILHRRTVALMTQNHLLPALLPYDLGAPEIAFLTRGAGFGFGVRVMMDVAQSGVLGSVGEYGWGGAANTLVWIDPKEAMICLLMMQFMPPFLHPVDRQFKNLAYQALID